MSKHTPGPWSYTHNNGSDFDLVGANGEQVVSGCGCCGSPNLGAGEEADARLIAAAPEMLEALEALLSDDMGKWLVSCGAVKVNAVRKAINAIAKATGEQP